MTTRNNKIRVSFVLDTNKNVAFSPARELAFKYKRHPLNRQTVISRNNRWLTANQYLPASGLLQ